MILRLIPLNLSPVLLRHRYVGALWERALIPNICTLKIRVEMRLHMINITFDKFRVISKPV